MFPAVQLNVKPSIFHVMEDRKITEKESLEVITSMISRTKERYIGDGNIMLMWGYLTVTVAALIWILLITTHNPAWNWLWFLIWVVGGTLTPIMARKEERSKGVKSYSDKITSQIWSVVGYSAIAMTAMCLGFLLVKGLDAWSTWFAFALIIVPFAEIAQGIIVREKSLTVGGSLGMVAGIFTLCCLISGVRLYVNWFMPVFMAAFICMMIMPGHVLNHKAHKEK